MLQQLTGSIRNKLLVTTGIGTALLLAAVVYGVAHLYGSLLIYQEMAASQPHLAEEIARQDALTNRGILMSAGLMALAILAAFVAFLRLVQRQIVGPAQQLVRDLERLAAGDFSRPVACTTHDELGQVARSAQHIQDQLGAMIGQVRGAVEQLVTAAGQLSEVADGSARGAEEQQAEISRVATAMREMASTVQEVASSAAEASEATGDAERASRAGRELVTESADAVRRLAEAMEHSATSIDALDRQNASIDDVLTVIHEVAEQTNLLALNAAIEAARAGEQGRGFAVVAEEVRGLAMRTQQSPQEIRRIIDDLRSSTRDTVDLIRNSHDQTQALVDQVNRSGDALAEIDASVQRVNDMNARIASAAEEQSATADAVSEQLVSINASADTGAEQANTTRVASSDLAALAGELRQHVEGFRLAATAAGSNAAY